MRATTLGCVLLLAASVAEEASPTPTDGEQDLLVAAGEEAPSPGGVRDLLAADFDRTLLDNREVLVTFHRPGSPRSKEIMPILERLSRSSEHSSMVHARVDVTGGNPTYEISYVFHHGLTRLPTVVLFVNGHPELYPTNAPIDSYSELHGWLGRGRAGAVRPRNAFGLFEPEGEPVPEKLRELRERHRSIFERQAAAMREAKEAGEKGSYAEYDDGPNPLRRAKLKPIEPAEPGAEGTEPAEEARGAEEAREEAAADAMFGADEPSSRPQAFGERNAGETACHPLDFGADIGADFRLAADPEAPPECFFVLFYSPSAAFCVTSGKAYASLVTYLSPISGTRAGYVDTSEHAPPRSLGLDDARLPVVLLFRGGDVARPVQYDAIGSALTAPGLIDFALEQCAGLSHSPSPEPAPEDEEEAPESAESEAPRGRGARDADGKLGPGALPGDTHGHDRREEL